MSSAELTLKQHELFSTKSLWFPNFMPHSCPELTCENIHSSSWKLSRFIVKVVTVHHENFHGASWKFSHSIGKVFPKRRDSNRETLLRCWRWGAVAGAVLSLREFAGFLLSHCHAFLYHFRNQRFEVWQKVWQMWQMVTIKIAVFVTLFQLYFRGLTHAWQMWQ